MRRGPGRRVAALIASTILLVGAAAAPAAAAEPEEHCLILLEEGGADVEVCAPTLADADAAFAAATGATRVESEASRDASGARVVFTLATLYTDIGFSGSSYTFTRSTACDGSTVSGVSSLASVGINDAVSSFATFSSCQVRLYHDAGFAGGAFGYTTSQSSLPSFNDVASSAHVR